MENEDTEAAYQQKYQHIGDRYGITFTELPVHWAVHVNKTVDDWKAFAQAFKKIDGVYGSKKRQGWSGFLFDHDPTADIEASEALSEIKTGQDLKFYIFEVRVLEQDKRVETADWKPFINEIKFALGGKHTWALGGENGKIVTPKSLDDPAFMAMREDKKQSFLDWKASSAAKTKVDVKCPTCSQDYTIELPNILIEDENIKEVGKLGLKLACGHYVEILLDKNFKIGGDNKAFARPMDEKADTKVDFDVDAFLAGKEEIEDLFPSLDLEWVGVGGKAKFQKPLSELVPTTPEMKTEEQIQTEQAEIEKEIHTDKGKLNVRVVKFEEILKKNDSIDIKKFSKVLDDLEQETIIGFIKAFDNGLLLSYNEKKKKVIIEAAAKPEIHIITQKFEKWLRFGKI
ncbi:MAG TPA: hypothetical protein VKM55_18230 [Candidatus Lokiarchaeia archaeon]|nr:hypothetical protein [Candidatus Lokiarchaeia archaeon]